MRDCDAHHRGGRRARRKKCKSRRDGGGGGYPGERAVWARTARATPKLGSGESEPSMDGCSSAAAAAVREACVWLCSACVRTGHSLLDLDRT